MYNAYILIDYRMAIFKTASNISTRSLNISWRTITIVIQNSCLSAYNINFYVLILRLTYLQSGGSNTLINLLLKPKQQTKDSSVYSDKYNGPFAFFCSYDLDESEQQHIICYFMRLHLVLSRYTIYHSFHNRLPHFVILKDPMNATFIFREKYYTLSLVLPYKVFTLAKNTPKNY